MRDGPGNAIATLSPDHRVVVADSGPLGHPARTDVSHHEKKETKPAVKKAAPATKKAAPAKTRSRSPIRLVLTGAGTAAHDGL
jgi:hypothetical protein